eukprot:COSAG01_NODE_2815_length_7021_cov_7.545363_1_plen_29_part_10
MASWLMALDLASMGFGCLSLWNVRAWIQV